jgi:hypothetical protein
MTKNTRYKGFRGPKYGPKPTARRMQTVADLQIRLAYLNKQEREKARREYHEAIIDGFVEPEPRYVQNIDLVEIAPGVVRHTDEGGTPFTDLRGDPIDTGIFNPPVFAARRPHKCTSSELPCGKTAQDKAFLMEISQGKSPQSYMDSKAKSQSHLRRDYDLKPTFDTLIVVIREKAKCPPCEVEDNQLNSEIVDVFQQKGNSRLLCLQCECQCVVEDIGRHQCKTCEGELSMEETSEKWNNATETMGRYNEVLETDREDAVDQEVDMLPKASDILTKPAILLCRNCDSEPPFSAPIILRAGAERKCPTCSSKDKKLAECDEYDVTTLWVPLRRGPVRLYCGSCMDQKIIQAGERSRCDHCKRQLDQIKDAKTQWGWDLLLKGKSEAALKEFEEVVAAANAARDDDDDDMSF